MAGRGVFQWSTLSPLLYCIYTVSVCDSLPSDTKILMYANDIIFYTTSFNIRSTYESPEIALHNVCEELGNLRLKISCEKSKLCIFSKSKHIKIRNFIRKYNIQYRLKYAGIEIPLVDSVKFLGVAFDSGLKWKQHALDSRVKCRLRINVLKSISGITWGAHPSTTLRIYRGWIRSVLQYGYIVFAGCATNVRG